MTYRFRLRRRLTGADEPPADHLAGEMAVAEVGYSFWYGWGDVGGAAEESHRLFYADGDRLWHDIIGAEDGSTEFVGDGSELTGIVTRFGTNDDGAARLIGGVQIAWRRALVLSDSSIVDWTFAAAFSDLPTVTATSLFDGGPRIVAVSNVSTTTASLLAWDETGTRRAPGVRITAMGRWAA